MIAGMINNLVQRAVGLLGPARAFELATGSGGYLQRRAWSWLNNNQMALPEDVRRKFSEHKWSSEWFVKEWFSRPVHVLHVEFWHHVWRFAQQCCRVDPAITAIDDYGCGNGCFIRSSPLVLPSLTVYRGWEFSETSLALLRERYPDTPVTFEKTSVTNLVKKPERAIITTIGVLCYMAQPELETWLAAISTAKTKKTVILAEPSEYALEYRPSSEIRAGDTYNHSYVQLVENARLKVTHSKVILWPNEHPWVVIVAETN
jgi:hypothetical protein